MFLTVLSCLSYKYLVMCKSNEFFDSPKSLDPKLFKSLSVDSFISQFEIRCAKNLRQEPGKTIVMKQKKSALSLSRCTSSQVCSRLALSFHNFIPTFKTINASEMCYTSVQHPVSSASPKTNTIA